MKVLLGISGASGSVYGMRAGELLLSAGVELHVMATKTAWEIMAGELPGDALPPGVLARKEWMAQRLKAKAGSLFLYEENDFGIPFVSGSNPPDAAVIAPCSMGMLGRIARGVSSSALERCADVALKEGKPLILVPRETPLSSIHLENMLALSRAGAVILPACPGFYNRPEKVEDLVDFVVSRVLARLGIDAGTQKRWGEDAIRGYEPANRE